MGELKKITSFTVDHDYITEGVYISRVDGDITTYDMRTRVPNAGYYMDNLTMHSFEHLFATLVRNSAIKDNVIYFGPMGCQTGFYLLVRDTAPEAVYEVIVDILGAIASYSGEMPGNKRKECGNFRNLSVDAASAEAKRYLEALGKAKYRFEYPKGE